MKKKKQKYRNDTIDDDARREGRSGVGEKGRADVSTIQQNELISHFKPVWSLYKSINPILDHTPHHSSRTDGRGESNDDEFSPVRVNFVGGGARCRAGSPSSCACTGTNMISFGVCV